jgi:hypothetical protein
MDRLEEQKRRARLAYEKGRGRHALLAASPFVMVGALAGAAEGVTTSLIGALLVFTVAAAALFRGQDVGRAIVPGALAGALPVAMVTLSMRYAHVCTTVSCTSVCLAACAVGGTLAAAIVHLHARRAESPRQAWLGGAAVATAMGMVACTCLGTLGLVAVTAGLVVGSLPRATSRAYAR